MTSYRVNILLRAALGLAILAGATTGASAADFGSIKDTPPQPGRVWYLKGFIGMHNYDSDDIWNEVFETNDFTIHHQDFKSGPFFGIGIGAVCHKWLRWDVTGEYRGTSTYFAQDSYPGGVGFPPGANEFTADIESWVGLANLYVDIKSWHGITPFFGAGIGVASIEVNGLKDVNVPNASVFYGADNSETNFAWALYAGLGYAVTENVTLELAYRYLELGDASSGTVTAYDGSSSYSGVFLDDVHSHDLMLAMRWKLDREAPEPALK
jgi:Opacity protein and related surface antigens